MIDIRQVLCPTDLSHASRKALDHAIVIARRYNARLTVLHVEPSPEDVLAPDLLDRTADVQAFVAQDVTPDVRIEVQIRRGDPVDEIVREVKAQPADLLVMGNHGRSGIERFFLGSTTERLVRKASCPVLTVPHLHADTVPADPLLFKRVLCPIDFSAASRKALAYAATLTQETDGVLTVVHVLTQEFDPLGARPMDQINAESMTLGDYFRWREQTTREMLETVVPPSVRDYCTVQTRLVRGKPGVEVLTLADEVGCDLIVMGVQGRGAADLAMFGSVAQYVTRYGSRPVLTVKG